MKDFFRIATEGKTIDGRKITAAHIKQMAANYNTDKYAARIWVEHMRSLLPDGAFAAVGDVLELKTETNSDGKLVLLARIEPTADLVKMNQNKQKLFTSIELDPNFADSGEAYLVGLAVTDSPASIGTERLAFNAITKEKEHLFSAYHDAEIEFDEEPAAGASNEDDSDNKPSIFSRVKELLGKHTSDQNEKTNHQFNAFYQDVIKTVEQVIEDYSSRDKARIEQCTAIEEKYKQLQADFDAFKKSLDATPSAGKDDYTSRPVADGQSIDAAIETDC